MDMKIAEINPCTDKCTLVKYCCKLFQQGLFLKCIIKKGLSQTKHLMSPEKIFMSSAKFTILISWSPFCTPLFPCHYH